MEEKRKCGLYIRVSTPEQARGGESLDEQQERTSAFCKYKGWIDYKIFREEGRSAKDTNRPEFQKLMADIRAGRINTVIVKKIDRFSRSIIDFENTYGIFEKHGVDFISLQENFDTTTAIGRAALRIILIFAQLEREQTGERIKDILQHKAQQGLPPVGGHALLGLRIDPETKQYSVVEEEAPIVRTAFGIYLKKGSLAKTAQTLNEQGYRTKAWTTPTGKEMGGKRFDKKHVTRILQNPVYAGKIYHNGNIYDGRHEPIISPVIFKNVQNLLEQNELIKTSYRENKFMLKGILFCGHCRRAMTPSFTLKKYSNKAGEMTETPYLYYRCTNENDTSKDKCPVGSVNANQIEALIIEEIRKLSHNEELLKDVIEESTKDAKTKIAPKRKEQQKLQGRLKSVEDKARVLVDRIVESKRGKDITVLMKRVEEYDTEIKDLRKQTENIEFEIRELENQVISTDFVVSNFRDFDRLWDNLEFEERYDIVHFLIKKIIYKEAPSSDPEDNGNKGRKKKGSIKLDFFSMTGKNEITSVIKNMFVESVSLSDEQRGAFQTRDAPLAFIPMNMDL